MKRLVPDIRVDLSPVTGPVDFRKFGTTVTNKVRAGTRAKAMQVVDEPLGSVSAGTINLNLELVPPDGDD